ncbi:M16 family metallopeptidase [Vibrio atypicus]|uniref:M16 family metallopeptidase n=1 Tax=Vibrio atypicus TaxID=558271 RepID=UPI00373576B2
MRIILLLISFVLIGCTQPNGVTPIEPDNNWVTGQLENGVKYHIYPSDNEPVSLRLFIHAGSAQETEQQKGYAHFLEHMAFNGSTHFTSNDMVAMFEAAGLTFGADINAYTSYYETVYKLDLPDNQQLEPGMMWLRDIADGLTLSASEVEKEKGVIQGEIRRTRHEQKSLSEKYYDHLIDGTALETLDPVGNKASVANATSESIRAFYETWYQPQYTEVVVTGDINVEQIEKLIQSKFSDWKAADSVADNSIEKPALTLTDYTDTIGEFDAPSLSLVIERAPAKIDTREQQLASWLDEIALQLIYQRLETVYQDSAMPVQSLTVTPYYMNYQRNALFSLAFAKEDRQATQDLFLETLASLRDHGVSQTEADSSIAYYQQLLHDIDYNWSQQDAVTFAENRVWAISTKQSSQSKLDYQQSLEALLKVANLERVNQQIRSILDDQYFVILGADESESVEHLATQIFPVRSKLAQEGAKPLSLLSIASELTSPTKEGTVLSQQTNALGFHTWQLSNGVEVWLETDTTIGDSVNLVYASQGGKASLEPELYAASQLAIPVVVRSGLGEFKGNELDAYLRRNSIEVFPFINFTHHGIEMGTTKAKIADAFNVIYNISTNINVDERQIEAIRKESYQDQQRYLATPIGQWERGINRNSYLPSSRHAFITAPELATVTADQIRQVHRTLFTKDRGYKLVIVADLTPEELTPLLRHFIASIPLESEEKPSFKVAYNLDPQARIDMPEYNEQNSIYLVRVTNPQAQTSSAKTAFIDDMIQRLLSKRLTSYVREELGLDYAPDAYSVAHDQEPSTDWFIEAQVAPGDIDKIDSAIDKVIAELLSDVTQSELNTVAKQLAVALHPLKDKPIDRTWFYTRYLIHGYGVESLKDVDGMTASITMGEFKQRIEEAFGVKSLKSKYTLTPAQ